LPSVLSPKYEVFCCDQNGPPRRRSEPDWRMEGAYLSRYVTDGQRSRRPIFIATLWAGASWLFFRVARSTRMTQIWALRSRLEKQPTDLRQNTSYFGDRTLRLLFLLLLPMNLFAQATPAPESPTPSPTPAKEGKESAFNPLLPLQGGTKAGPVPVEINSQQTRFEAGIAVAEGDVVV